MNATTVTRCRLLSLGVAAWAALGPAAPSISQPVTVDRLSGEPVRGRLASATTERVVVETEGGPVVVKRQALPMITFAASRRPALRYYQPPGDAADASRDRYGRAWLSDGTVVPVADAVLPPGEESIRFDLPRGAGISPGSFTARLDRVVAVRLPGTRAKPDPQWDAFRTGDATDDRLVMVRREGGALDYVEGFVESIDQEQVTIVLEGDPIGARRERVYGVVFGGVGESKPAAGPTLTTLDGARFPAASLSCSPGQQADVRTAGGFEFTVDAERLATIDYRVGRVAYLSDLEPVDARHRPLLGVPRGLSSVGSKPGYSTDAAFWGGPLTIRGGDSAVPRSFAKGVSLRSGGEVVYRLDGGYSKFVATAAVNPLTDGPRRLRLLIEVDGRVAADHELKTTSAPTPIEIDVRGGRRLSLRVVRQQSLDASIHLGDARLVR